MFTRTTAELNGGAVYAKWSSPNTAITGCMFTWTTARYGGAVYTFGPDTAITGCMFTRTTAYSGGAVYAGGPNAILLAVSYCAFRALATSERGGGAIFADVGSSLMVSNTGFSDTTAGGSAYGGAVRAKGPNTAIAGCIFTRTTAGGDGGAVYAEGPNTAIAGCIFTRTAAGGQGGAVDARGPNIAIAGCMFTRTRARYGGNGGAVYARGPNIAIAGCMFTHTTAGGNGGAVYAKGPNTGITSCMFTRTTAKWYGGAVYAFGANTAITGCNFTRTKAKTGGAVDASGGNTAITGCNFTQTTALSGGAIFSTGARISIVASNFHGSSATLLTGGAVHGVQLVSFTVIRSTFTKCTSKGNGGAVEISLVGGGLILGSSFVSIRSQGTGGALYVQGDMGLKSWFRVLDSRFQDCLALFAAGAAAILGMAKLDLTNLVLNNGTSRSGAVLGTTALVTDSQMLTMNATSMRGNANLPMLASSNHKIQLVGASNVSCDRGQELIRSHSDKLMYYHCSKCESGTFNMWGGFAVESTTPQRGCDKCPTSALCTSSSAFVPAGIALFPTYTPRRMHVPATGGGGWSTTDCPNKNACPSRNISAGNLDHGCQNGYMRPEYGCSICSDGYGMQSDPLLCQLCPEPAGRILSLFLLVVIESFPILISLKVARSMGMQVYEGSTLVSAASPLLKMFLSFTTIMGVYQGSVSSLPLTQLSL